MSTSLLLFISKHIVWLYPRVSESLPQSPPPRSRKRYTHKGEYRRTYEYYPHVPCSTCFIENRADADIRPLPSRAHARPHPSTHPASLSSVRGVMDTVLLAGQMFRTRAAATPGWQYLHSGFRARGRLGHGSRAPHPQQSGHTECGQICRLATVAVADGGVSYSVHLSRIVLRQHLGQARTPYRYWRWTCGTARTPQDDTEWPQGRSRGPIFGPLRGAFA